MATLVTGTPARRAPERRNTQPAGLTPVPGGGYRLSPEGPIPKPAEPTGPVQPGPTAAPPPVAPLTLTAQDDPRLTALNDRYNKYLDSYEKGAGGAMDLAAQRFRDAREGARAAGRENAALTGQSGDMTAFDAETLRGENKAIADVAAGREAAMGENLRGGLPIAGAPGEANRADRGLGLQTWMAQQQAAQQQWENQRNQSTDAFQQFLALLQAQRTSPTGAGVTIPGVTPAGPGGGLVVGRGGPTGIAGGGQRPTGTPLQPMRIGGR